MAQLTFETAKKKIVKLAGDICPVCKGKGILIKPNIASAECNMCFGLGVTPYIFHDYVRMYEILGDFKLTIPQKEALGTYWRFMMSMSGGFEQ